MKKKKKNTTCIHLSNLTFYAYHGLYSEERLLGTRYEIDVKLKVFFDDIKHIELSSTINYKEVCNEIKAVVCQKNISLLEALAKEISTKLLQSFKKVHKVTVFVRKRNPPIDAICDYAEVIYKSKRDW